MKEKLELCELNVHLSRFRVFIDDEFKVELLLGFRGLRLFFPKFLRQCVVKVFRNHTVVCVDVTKHDLLCASDWVFIVEDKK